MRRRRELTDADFDGDQGGAEKKSADDNEKNIVRFQEFINCGAGYGRDLSFSIFS